MTGACTCRGVLSRNHDFVPRSLPHPTRLAVPDLPPLPRLSLSFHRDLSARCRYRCNDSYTSRITDPEREVVSKDAYLLVYERRSARRATTP